MLPDPELKLRLGASTVAAVPVILPAPFATKAAELLALMLAPSVIDAAEIFTVVPLSTPLVLTFPLPLNCTLPLAVRAAAARSPVLVVMLIVLPLPVTVPEICPRLTETAPAPPIKDIVLPALIVPLPLRLSPAGVPSMFKSEPVLIDPPACSVTCITSL